MYEILLTVFGIWATIEQSRAQKTSNLEYEEGDRVTLSCSLAGTYSFPAWSGPPSLLPYTNLGDTSGKINPSAPAADRLSYSNNQDLVLHPAFVNDSGVYKCSFTELGDHTITLNITEKSTTTTPPRPCWCKKWWGIVIIVVIICCLLFFCGIVIGIFKYSCKDGPCNTFYVGDRIPKWVKGLTIIIVGLGILTVYRICKGRGRFNAKNESEPDPMQEKMKMAEDLAPRDQDKNAL